MLRPRFIVFALLLTGCTKPGSGWKADLSGTTWLSPLTPEVVDTLAFEPGGNFRWYSAELRGTSTGTYRRTGDTLFLQERLGDNPSEEERGQGPGQYRMVLRSGKLEVVYAWYDYPPEPKTTFDPPLVFTPVR